MEWLLAPVTSAVMLLLVPSGLKSISAELYMQNFHAPSMLFCPDSHTNPTHACKAAPFSCKRALLQGGKRCESLSDTFGPARAGADGVQRRAAAAGVGSSGEAGGTPDGSRRLQRPRLYPKGDRLFRGCNLCSNAAHAAPWCIKSCTGCWSLVLSAGVISLSCPFAL